MTLTMMAIKAFVERLGRLLSALMVLGIAVVLLLVLEVVALRIASSTEVL